MIYEVILHCCRCFRSASLNYTIRIERYSCISYSAPSALRRIAYRVRSRFILHTRASKEPLGCWLADWPQTHPPSPVAAATLVASLGSPPISRFFGWLVGSFHTDFWNHFHSFAQRDTQTLTHAHSHTLTQRQPPSSALCWGICLAAAAAHFPLGFFLLLFLLTLLVQFRRRRRHVVAYFPIYEIICAKTILLRGEKTINTSHLLPCGGRHREEPSAEFQPRLFRFFYEGQFHVVTATTTTTSSMMMAEEFQPSSTRSSAY